MNRRIFFFALLSALLFFGQQGAAVHAVSHLAENLPGHSQQQDQNLPHSPACDKCVVYAGVGSALATASFDFSGFAGVSLQQAVLPASVYYLSPKVYFSGAPPPRA